MFQVNAEEAKNRLPALIEAALRGETVVIADDDEHQVQLVPIVVGKHVRHAGSAKGTLTVGDDFEDPLPDFEAYEP
jgi:antitoxin (DNA-binding transcriptional repressor) of toxin-antitoxin stability system